MFRLIAAGLLAAFVATSSATAQTIYAPVQYVYGEGPGRYYYGGSDPAVFALAERQACLEELMDHVPTSRRYNDAYIHRRLIGQVERVYSDCVPYVNARPYGYLPVDAANAAYRNVPHYFRKVDLLEAAVELPDGSRVVPAHARPVSEGRDRAERPATRPIRPRAIIIIPKSKPGTSDKLVASAGE